MKQGIFQEHWNDDQGRPAGGVSSGRGLAISWQNGPLGRGDQRREPNGAFVEDVIQAAIGRIEFYEQSEFACDANKEALAGLRQAAEALDRRTQEREARGVEGEHQR